MVDPASQRPEGIAARKVAVDLLAQVLDKGQPLDSLLDSDPGFRATVTRDRAFVRMIVSTALRRLGQIDALIARAMDRAEAPHPPLLRHILRVGVAQIAFMAVPTYAVVDTAVRLAEDKNLSRQKGLVNAVLRRVADDYLAVLPKQDEGRLNTPDWLLQSWIADYGMRRAGEIAQANLSEAPLDITLRDPDSQSYWAGRLDAVALPMGTLRRPAGGMVYELPGYDEGLWWVQDAAASLPATLFGDIEGAMVLDLCAAPGGKTAQLAALGADIVALDRSVTRLKRLRENLDRLKLAEKVRVEAADAGVWQPKEKADFVMLDAPCTATGTIRRHPDVLHLKTPQDMARLCETQARILRNASAMLAPGGTLIYCTCSLQKDEGERQIDAFLAAEDGFSRVPVDPSEIGGLAEAVTAEGDVRLLPDHFAPQGGIDGFYICRLRKTG
ncbi:MAG: methyltransferase domain-containing protein [Alphaproteobacteria bacterium]|nr:methyltransferase domain-containing protein [Alphaproteobacteria bacterium]